MFIAMKDFDYNTLSPKTINIIPPESVIAKWEEDYNKMQTMIYGKSMLFSDIINKITNLNEDIKSLGW
jgi:archaellum component FlaC